MATFKFNRTYSFKVGDSTIENVRVRFRIDHLIAGFIPFAQFELYNLAPNTRSNILVQDAEFSFTAGYVELQSLLFKGVIRNVFTRREDVDTITTVSAGGSDAKLREALINKTLANPKSLTEVMQDYLNDVGITVGEINIVEQHSLGSITYSAPFIQVMNELARSYKFEWYMFNGLFYAYDIKANTKRSVFEITTGSGLLETPILTEAGVDVKTLLEPSIRPGDRYLVESQGIQVAQNALSFTAARLTPLGVQKALEVHHTGDTHTNQWYTELRGLNVDFAE